MLKHNKKRNTAFLFEAVVKEITNLSLGNDVAKRDLAIQIIKEHFNKSSELYKELQLYKAILETKNIPSHMAEKIISNVKEAHSRINQKKLYNEQTALIVAVNNNLSKTSFENFVPNFKNLASVSQIFKKDTPPKTRVLLEQHLVGEMSRKKVVEKVIEQKEQKQVSKLVLKTFIERYNSTYSTLTESQKNLLNKFILSDSEQTEFFVVLNEEIGKLKEKLLETIKEFPDYKENLTEVYKKLDSIKNKTHIEQKDLSMVLKTQDILKELDSHGTN